MIDAAEIRQSKDLKPEVRADPDRVMVAIVTYKNPSDLCTCLSALSKANATNFAVSVCENGGLASFKALIAAVADVVEFDTSAPETADFRVVEARSGRL